MLKTLLKEVKEYKRVSIVTPVFMIVEVLMETLIPFLMASIIDEGVNAGNMQHIYKVGGIMVVAAAVGLFAGLAGGRFGAKASAGYIRAKEIIKLINSVADVINNDRSINGKLKVVFIEDYRVSNAELIFAAADISEQISTASKEASGTGNMKFMMNGAPTLGTMDGANVEIVDEVGIDNAFIFGLSADEVINYEQNGGYNPYDIYNNDPDIHRVVDQMVDGTYSNGDTEMYRDLYNSLLNNQGGSRADMYFILKDFRSYADAQARAMEAYKDKEKWAKMALKNTACCGKFSADRTIQEYVDDIWHLDHVVIDEDELEY